MTLLALILAVCDAGVCLWLVCSHLHERRRIEALERQMSQVMPRHPIDPFTGQPFKLTADVDESTLGIDPFAGTDLQGRYTYEPRNGDGEDR